MSVVDDAILLKMAEAEILGEAKRAAIRHSVVGVSGWQPGPKPNKTFLTNTLLQTVASNRILENNKKIKGEKNLKCCRIDRKLIQKNCKTDTTANFVYQKPKKNKNKNIINSKNSKHIKNNSVIKSEDKHFKSVKKNYNNKNVKLKKNN